MEFSEAGKNIEFLYLQMKWCYIYIYIYNPIRCVPDIINLLQEFGTFSGYKLNFTKSICFPINEGALQIPEAGLPFHTSRSGFKYSGIEITRRTDLFQENVTPLLDKLKLECHTSLSCV